jgi:hypothetical protein
MLHKTITIKGFNGNYATIKKQFQDEKHFNNWYAKVNKGGAKIVGVTDTEFMSDDELRTYLEGRGYTEAQILEWIKDKNDFIQGK